MALKIALTGPESTAKTSLAMRLSATCKVTWIAEYSREYLHVHGNHYQASDILKMSEEYLLKLKNLQNVEHTVLLDTDLLTYIVWYKFKYGQPPDSLINGWKANAADFYLLCYPDLLWQSDPLRENPLDRMHLFNEFLHLLHDAKLPYGLVTGSGRKRINRALFFIHQLTDLK